jgi:hypothetical protein
MTPFATGVTTFVIMVVGVGTSTTATSVGTRVGAGVGISVAVIEGIGDGVALGMEVGDGWIMATAVGVVALMTPCPLSAPLPASEGVTVCNTNRGIANSASSGCAFCQDRTLHQPPTPINTRKKIAHIAFDQNGSRARCDFAVAPFMDE